MTSDLRPMLAGSTNPRNLPKLAEDDRFAFEQKIDGMRLIVSTGDGTTGGIGFFNRKGEPFKQFIPSDLAGKMATLGAGFVLDGEIVEDLLTRRTLFIFDVLDTPAGTTVHKTFDVRRHVLEHVFSLWSVPGVELLPSYTSRIDKLNLARTLLGNGGEGVMVRDRSGIYVPGLRSPALMKAKFVKDIDVIITGKRINGKDNLAFGVYDNGRLVPLGEVTALAGDGATLEIGDVATVQYLYAVDPQRPKLVQPTRPTKRLDKSANECTLNQISFTDKHVLTANDLLA